MIIDMHTHVWGGQYELHTKELVENCEKYKVDKIFVSGIAKQYPSEAEVEQYNADVVRFRKEQPELVEGCHTDRI